MYQLLFDKEFKRDLGKLDPHLRERILGRALKDGALGKGGMLVFGGKKIEREWKGG